jgi:hypothetical protein
MLRSFVLGAACVMLSSGLAEARPTRTASAEPAATESAPVAAIRPVSVTTAESNQVCGRARRRLWIEGEGWVVRKVATCR